MHEELENFERNQVWTLVDPPRDVNVIGTKWVFKNKHGEDGEVVRNKASPRSSHRTAVQRVFRYLKHTPEFGIWYSASSLDLVGFSYADFAGCGIDRKSTSETRHFLGSSLVCWSSQKQYLVAQSTTEAECVATASCCS
jgi:hypothetical protein